MGLGRASLALPLPNRAPSSSIMAGPSAWKQH